MHQPAWSLFDAIRLAGVDPTAGGYTIDPELPFKDFSLALPDIGVRYRGSVARGYVVTEARGALTMEVQPPAGRHWRVYGNGHVTAAAYRAGMLSFRLRLRPGRAATWEIKTLAHAAG